MSWRLATVVNHRSFALVSEKRPRQLNCRGSIRNQVILSRFRRRRSTNRPSYVTLGDLFFLRWLFCAGACDGLGQEILHGSCSRVATVANRLCELVEILLRFLVGRRKGFAHQFGDLGPRLRNNLEGTASDV